MEFSSSVYCIATLDPLRTPYSDCISLNPPAESMDADSPQQQQSVYDIAFGLLMGLKP